MLVPVLAGIGDRWHRARERERVGQPLAAFAADRPVDGLLLLSSSFKRERLALTRAHHLDGHLREALDRVGHPDAGGLVGDEPAPAAVVVANLILVEIGKALRVPASVSG